MNPANANPNAYRMGGVSSIDKERKAKAIRKYKRTRMASAIKKMGTYNGKSNKLGGGGRFAQVAAKAGGGKKGAAIAAAIGRAKYGAKKFGAMSAKGRKKA
jgi:hypothetical protein